MTRKPFHIVKAAPKPRVTFSLLKRAIRLFKHEDVTKEQWKANARSWVRSNLLLGDRHILKSKAPAKWGKPGLPGQEQVFAPRGYQGGK